MSRLIDLLGQRFGKWTVIERSENNHTGQSRWLCQCDCGIRSYVTGGNLRTGTSRSCGCASSRTTIGERARTHGMSKSRVYRLWQGIKKRCNAPTSQNYQYYGGRGIAVCRRWEESFDAFLSDMGEPPSPHHSIERIDNNGNYGPSNCKWIPQHLQVQNTRVTRDITIHGQTHCLSEWARRSGVPVATLKRRLDHGVNPERAILPDRMHRERKH